MIPNGPRSLGKNFATKIKGGYLPLDLVFISSDNLETQRNAVIVRGPEGEGTCEEGVLADFDLERDCVDRTVCILTNDRVPRGRGGEDFLGDRISRAGAMCFSRKGMAYELRLYNRAHCRSRLGEWSRYWEERQTFPEGLL